jgi:3',5'-cyclic AMP phosphodiesterase CpdA
MFRLAHLSDPHLGPLPPVRGRDLLNKRLTGYANWRLGRRDTHDMGTLAALIADVKAQAPDHIVVGGDFANIGLAAEFDTARRFLEGLGSPETVSAVPGNHDVYVARSGTAMRAQLGPWMTGDEGGKPRFPYLKRRGRVALIGLSSGVPTLPFMASGRLGRAQIERLDALLAGLDGEAARIVMLHHPPQPGGATRLRQLTDAAALRAVLARHGCEAVLHGHNHKAMLATLPGPAGPIPVIGAPSASARGAPGGKHRHSPGWWLIEIDETAPRGRQVTARLRGREAGEGRFAVIAPDRLPSR